MYNPWWHNREIDRYHLMAYRERIRKELEEPKILTKEEIGIKLCELKEMLDTFKGQTIPKNLIPCMRDLHEALIDAHYVRLLKPKPKKKNLLRRLFK